MEPQPTITPLIVIIGATASGKTELSLRLAQLFNGEIIAADSRTVYKEMDIGTAKPTAAEQQSVPHHLLNLTTPDRPITVAGFKGQAEYCIQDIAARGRLPFLVGGSGLYVDAVAYDFSFRSPPDVQLRQRLQQLSVDELQAQIVRKGLQLPQNDRNPRHLIRQIESAGEPPARRASLRPSTVLIGIDQDKDALQVRITRRVDAMLEAGLADEARKLATDYGWECVALQTIGYQEFRQYFEGTHSIEQVREEIVRDTLRYAKRQRTWFRRNQDIHWLCKEAEAVDLITSLLNK